MNDNGFGVEIESTTPPVLRASGEIDIETCDQFAAAIAAASDRGRAHTLVIDMAKVEFIDSSGLAVLVSATRNGTSVILRNASDVVRTVVEATGLGPVLRLE